MMRTAASLIALILTLAVTTVIVGWWTVPVVAFGWTLASPRRAAVFYASFAGAVAWGSLLAWLARAAPVGAVDALMASIMDVPDRAIIALALAYAALLAGSAALVAQAIRPYSRKSKVESRKSKTDSR